MAVNNTINNILYGVTNGSNAIAGDVGEFISSVIASASAVANAGGSPVNMTSISLTAGDWDVWGNIFWGGTTYAFVESWISASSVTVPDRSLESAIGVGVSVLPNIGITVLKQRFSLASTTTVYITGLIGTSIGAGTMCGGIYARRVR